MTQNSPKPVSEIIERLLQLRDERAAIAKRDSELVEEFDELKGQSIGRMDEDGLDKLSSTLATISIGESVVPQIDDWDATVAHIKETGDIHLLQRRINSAAYREIIEAGGTVPGLSPFKKRELNIRRK